MQSQLNNRQIARLKRWHKAIKHLPQFGKPLWLIKRLSDVLPDYCIFARAKHVQLFGKQILWLYVPELCMLNPWHKAIQTYRDQTSC